MPGWHKLTRTHLVLLTCLILAFGTVVAASGAGAAAQRFSMSVTGKLHTALRTRGHGLSVTPKAAAPVAPQNVAVEVEPNDSLATANTLPLDAKGFAIGRGAITSGDSGDFWRLTAPSSSAFVWATVETGTQADANTELELYRSDGSLIERDDNDGASNNCETTLYSDLSSAISAAQAGGTTFYLRVKGKDALSLISSYKLLVVVRQATPTPEVESNNTAATANVLIPSGASFGFAIGSINNEIDYFSVAATAGSTVLLSGDGDPDRDGNSPYFGMTLLAPDGTTELFSVISPPNDGGADLAAASYCYTFPSTGTYFVRVDREGFTDTDNQYQLMASLYTSLAAADVATTITAPAMVNATENISYAITVSNNGPDTATNLSLTDTIPANTTFQSLTSPAGWNCTTPAVNGTGTVSCTRPSLASGAPQSFTLMVKTNAATPNNTAVSNTAAATSNTPDQTSGNDQATASTTVKNLVDLSVTKTGTASVFAGGNITYNISVANAGPQPALNATLTDTVPANTTFQSLSSPAGWNCTTPAVNGTGTINCTNASVAIGNGGFTLVVKSNSSLAGGTTISNTASVTTVSTDSASGNNSSIATTNVTPQADLAITQNTPASATAGVNFSYTVNLINNGPDAATNVAFNTTTPANTTFQALSSPAGWNCMTPAVNGTGTINCTIANLAAGAQRSNLASAALPAKPALSPEAPLAAFTVTLKVSAAAVAGTTITNTVSASSSTFDPATGNSTSSVSITLAALADLGISKTAPATVNAGGNISYSITITNGTGAATNVTLTDNTPANTTFVSLTSPSGWTCTTPAVNGTGATNCSIPLFNENSTVSFTLVVKTGTAVGNSAVISNTATVASATPDPTPGNNSSTATTTIVNQADLVLTKSGAVTAIAGQTLSYSFNLTNVGPNDASNVSFSDSLPAGTVFVSNTAPTGWNCTTPAANTNGTVNCTAANLANGSGVGFSLVVRVNANVVCDTTILNTASVSSSITDPNTTNNTSAVPTQIQTQSDLAVSVNAPATAVPDVSAVYTITITNAGPSNSANTLLNNALPSAFTVEAITTSAGTCSGIGTNAVNCTLGTLAVGATATITIQAHVPETCQPTTAVNTTTVITGNCLADPVAANNSQTKTTTVAIGNVGPGGCIPAVRPLSDSKPGSILFAGLFVSGAAGGSGGDPQNNTRVNLTNIHPTLGAVMHLFFVDGATCTIADAFICLTPNQTTSFLMSDLDPGTTGYMMAMVVDGPPGTAGGGNTGCPISFNYIIGNANIKLTNSPMREADLESESVASQFGSPLPGCDPNKGYAEIPFDGSPQGFNQLPLVLAIDNIGSRADGNDTMLLLARIDGNWGLGLKPIGNVFGILYNDAETSYSFSFNVGTCLFKSVISNNFPRTTPRFEQVVPAGRSGWMKLWSADDAAIIGAVLNRNDNVNSSPNAFNGGHNLHILRLKERAVVTVPVFPPSC